MIGGKYYNPPVEKDFIFNELYLDWNKDITIVEGVFDAIVARNCYSPAWLYITRK